MTGLSAQGRRWRKSRLVFERAQRENITLIEAKRRIEREQCCHRDRHHSEPEASPDAKCGTATSFEDWNASWMMRD